MHNVIFCRSFTLAKYIFSERFFHITKTKDKILKHIIKFMKMFTYHYYFTLFCVFTLFQLNTFTELIHNLNFQTKMIVFPLYRSNRIAMRCDDKFIGFIFVILQGKWIMLPNICRNLYST